VDLGFSSDFFSCFFFVVVRKYRRMKAAVCAVIVLLVLSLGSLAERHHENGMWTSGVVVGADCLIEGFRVVCKRFVGRIQEQLPQPRTPEGIAKVLDHACDQAPSGMKPKVCCCL
jgi:hypothetical protein